MESIQDKDYCNALAEKSLDDKESFAKLYDIFFDAVYNFVFYRLRNVDNANDLVSEIFLKVYAHLKDFDKNKSSFKTWLFTITNNALIDYFRYSNKNNTADFPNYFENLFSDETNQPERKLIIDEEKTQILAALDKLNDNERQLIQLKYWFEFSYLEIAEILNLTYSNVRIIHYRALKKLQKIFEI